MTSGQRFHNLSVLQSHYKLCLSTLTDQLIFRHDNTFHYQLLDIGNKFEEIGNKTANNKRKRKGELRDLNSLLLFFKVFVTRLCFLSLCLQGLRFRGLCFRGLCFRGLRFSRSAFSRSVLSRHPEKVFSIVYSSSSERYVE